VLDVGVGNLRIRDHLKGIRTNGANSEMDFQKQINRRILWAVAKTRMNQSHLFDGSVLNLSSKLQPRQTIDLLT